MHECNPELYLYWAHRHEDAQKGRSKQASNHSSPISVALANSRGSVQQFIKTRSSIMERGLNITRPLTEMVSDWLSVLEAKHKVIVESKRWYMPMSEENVMYTKRTPKWFWTPLWSYCENWAAPSSSPRTLMPLHFRLIINDETAMITAILQKCCHVPSLPEILILVIWRAALLSYIISLALKFKIRNGYLIELRQ